MILNTDAADANRLREWAQPVQPEAPSFSAWSFAKSGAKGVPSAGLEVAGSWADLLSGFAAPYAATYGEGQGAEQARQKMLAGSFDPSAGNVLRVKAEEFSPDPASSTQADQILFSITRGVSKFAGYAATMGGVPGAFAFGTDEANTTAQRLKEKGIDPSTAWQVGGVTGAAATAGGLIPLAGQTVVRTIGLGLLGGPVTFMAQEQAAKMILQEQYPDEASLHNPLDPAGLALSIAIPTIAGGLHIRAQAKRIESLKTEAQARTAATLTPEEQARSDAFERSAGNIAELQAAIKAEKNPASRAALEEELAKQTKQAQKHADDVVVQRGARDPEAVDAARVRVTEDRLQETLPEIPTARAEVMRAADDVAAGRVPENMLEPDPWDLPQPLPKPAAIADDLRMMADGAFWAQQGGQMIRSGISEAGDGGMGGAVTGRTPWIPAQEWFGRMRSDLGRDGLTSQEAIAAAVEKAINGEKLKASERRTVEWMQGEWGAMKQQAIQREWLDFEAEDLAGQGLRHGLGRNDMADLSLTARAGRIDPEAVEFAAINFSNNSAAFVAEMQRIIANGQEAAAEVTPGSSGARGAGVRSQAEAGPNTLPPADQVSAEPATAPAKSTEPGTLPALDAARIEALRTEQPDLRVSLPGHEGSMTLAEAMELTEREAALIRSDADLFKAAISCALQQGAALA